MLKKSDYKSITIHDVAKEAGVSKSTVSLVLTHSDKVSKKSKLKVEQAIHTTGYIYNRDAASLRSRKSNLVAIVINDLTNQFALNFVTTLERELRDAGMFSMLVSCNDELDIQHKLVNQLKEYNVNSFVICPVAGTTALWLNELVSQGYGVINILREVTAAKVATVLPDYYIGTKLATLHLLDKGFKNIAYVGGNVVTSDQQQKLYGFKDALMESGIDILDKNIKLSAMTRNDGRLVVNNFFKDKNKIDAIVCVNDVVAYGAIDVIKQYEKQNSKKIAIIGFDDLDESRLMSPALSTIHVNTSKMSGAVIHQLKDATSRNKILVEIDLVERETC